MAIEDMMTNGLLYPQYRELSMSFPIAASHTNPPVSTKEDTSQIQTPYLETLHQKGFLLTMRMYLPI